MEDRIVHSQPIDAVVQNVRTDLDNGLTREDARDRLQKFGLNELTERPRPGFLALLWDQFNNYLVIILIVAAVIAALLGEYVDALAIMCIVVLNAIIGVVQESKAEQALAALKKMAAPNAQVIRDGQQLTVPARELVPGDIVLLEAGNYVPADLRLVTSVNLKIEEASLTGESVPVEKQAALVPDVILDHCSHIQQAGAAVALTEDGRREVLEQNRSMATNALRVLGVAYRPLAEAPENPQAEQLERDLVFVGLLGMIDPARPEVVEAVKIARGAGLKSIMVTGDYKDTAEAIAAEIGLRTEGGLVLTGPEIEKLTDQELAARVEKLDVCCRVSPQHKTRIVDALKTRDHVVAMTGDGVNDAPALKRANIGVAMGITGTDVTKQTADMVLTDDNYASIVAAIEQGRIIYSNIRKFVYFLLACNAGEVLIIFGAMLAGMPIPLRPVHLLWLNLVSDGAPALALGMEKGDRDIMKHPPRPPREPVINRDMAIGISVIAVIDALAILLVFGFALRRYPGHIEAAQTMAFVTLCVSELLRAFTARSEYHSIFSIGVFSNRWMIGAVAVSFSLVMLVVYVPFLAPFFDTVPLTLNDWLFMMPFFFASPIAMELVKLYFRRRPRGAPAQTT